MNSMTAIDNSWVAATEAKLNATYALHIQETGRQPRAPVSNSASDYISKPRTPEVIGVNGSAHDVCIGRVGLTAYCPTSAPPPSTDIALPARHAAEFDPLGCCRELRRSMIDTGDSPAREVRTRIAL